MDIDLTGEFHGFRSAIGGSAIGSVTLARASRKNGLTLTMKRELVAWLEEAQAFEGV